MPPTRAKRSEEPLVYPPELIALGLLLGALLLASTDPLPGLFFGTAWGALVAAVLMLLVPQRSWCLVGLAAVAVAMVALFGLSQWPRGEALPPTAIDWAPWWAMFAASVGIVALAWIPIGLAGAPRPWGRFIGGTALLLVQVCVAGLSVWTAEPTEADGRPQILASAREITPLPRGLRIRSADPCTPPGTSGICTAEFQVAGTRGQPREEVLDSLAAHLRDRGWALRGYGFGYSACRPVRGLRRYADHCLSFGRHLSAYEVKIGIPQNVVVVTIAASR